MRKEARRQRAEMCGQETRPRETVGKGGLEKAAAHVTTHVHEGAYGTQHTAYTPLEPWTRAKL